MKQVISNHQSCIACNFLSLLLRTQKLRYDTSHEHQVRYLDFSMCSQPLAGVCIALHGWCRSWQTSWCAHCRQVCHLQTSTPCWLPAWERQTSWSKCYAGFSWQEVGTGLSCPDGHASSISLRSSHATKPCHWQHELHSCSQCLCKCSSPLLHSLHMWYTQCAVLHCD